MPFVQGRLRAKPVAVVYETECVCCSRPMRLEIRSDLHYRVEDEAAPLAYLPIVDFAKLKQPTIIDVF
jgi:hypothetical protein